MGKGGFCCLHCCDGLCNGINRIFNACLALAGFAFAGFGLFLAMKSAWNFDWFSIAVISVGSFIGLLTLLYTCCGHKSYNYNSLYIYSMIILILCNGTASGLLFAYRDQIYKQLQAELGDDFKFDKGIITITGYVALGLTGLQVLALILAWCHRNILIDIERDMLDLEDGYDALDDEEAPAPRRQQKQSELASRSTRSNEIAPQKDESEGSRAASKYRSKYADLYSKYGIDKK